MSAGTQGRLLVVDDEAAQMRALCETLRAEGYAVTGFRSAREALANLKAAEFDLLLTDLQMPEMDGIALLHAARAIDGDLAGVVMTGYATLDTAIQAMQVGALDYVRKPFRLNVLLPVLARALDIRRLRMENVRLLERERRNVAELEAANRDLESFSFSISHDLRAPLRAVLGFCEMYVERYGAEASKDAQRMLNHIMLGAQRMDRLIEDLLRFCRLSRQAVTKVPVELDALVRRVAAELEALTLEREPLRRVDVRIGALPDCAGDTSLLEQVFGNLLSNAFKFTRQREVAVIEVDGRVDDKEIVVSVRDNGAGFDMTYAAKLFGVFQRLHSADEFEGSGVGLSIVRRIVERHGGRTWGESAPGQGARFYFTLPR